MTFAIPADLIGTENKKLEQALGDDYASLGRQLQRRGIDIEVMTKRAMDYAVAIPTWGVGTGPRHPQRVPPYPVGQGGRL